MKAIFLNKLVFWIAVTGALTSFAETRLHLEDSATVESITTGKVFSVPRGIPYVWNHKEILRISKAGKTPIYLIANGASRDLQISQRNLDDEFMERLQKRIDDQMADAFVEVFEIESLIQQRSLNMANARYQMLRQKYPTMEFLKFLGATLEFMNGNLASAEKLAKEASLRHPNYIAGRKFLEKVKGRVQ